MSTFTLPASIAIRLPKGLKVGGLDTASISTEAWTSEMLERIAGFALKEYLNNACASAEADESTATKAITRVNEWARSAPRAASGPSADSLFLAIARTFLGASGVATKVRDAIKSREDMIRAIQGVYEKDSAKAPRADEYALARAKKIDEAVAVRVAAASDEIVLD